MIELNCRVHNARSATHDAGTLRLYDDGTVERDTPTPATLHINEVSVSQRVGQIPRRIVFPDGVIAETDENDAVDRALQRRGLRVGSGWLHRLESRWRSALAATAVGVAVVYFAIADGVPALAGLAARSLPAEAHAHLGERALATLDRTGASATRLPEARRAAVRERLAAVRDWAGAGDEAHLVFRRAPGLGTNALALPGGTIVMTDAPVALAASDRELAAVLAHEVGHVIHRHSVRRVLENAGVALVVIAATGDVSWLSASIPTALLSAGYSRAYEREADAFALEYLAEAPSSVNDFARILRRLEEAQGGAGSFLSGHPPTAERLERISAAR